VRGLRGFGVCGLIAIGLAGCGGRSAATPGAGSTTASSAGSRASSASGSQAPSTGQSGGKLSVVASGLANPRQLSVAADGAIYVAQAGDGGDSECTTSASGGRICIGETGSIARIEAGRTVRVVSGLPSVASPGGQEASGPADVVSTRSRLAFVVQDTDIDKSGANQFGALGGRLGHLVLTSTDGTGLRLVADLGRYEATHNPDRGAGAATASRIESDPYGLAAYRSGYVVADAAANDLLEIDASGRVSVLAVFPTQTEKTSSGRVVAQSVPTSVAVGPDGALYVGELTGAPFEVGAARVWRVVPGRAPTVFASGFTDISAIAFDATGGLLVLEIDQLGLTHPAGSGELIQVAPDHRRTILLSRGLALANRPSGGPGRIDLHLRLRELSEHGSRPPRRGRPPGDRLGLAGLRRRRSRPSTSERGRS
jgi:hypothetical protein